MQAVVLSKIGGLKYLHIQELSKPKPANNEVLIEVEYCGLNHLDLLIIEGIRLGPKTFPHILGSEFVGRIAKLNNKSNHWKIGDRVAVYPWTFCGKCQQCKENNENICDYGGTFGRTRWGGFAEYVSVPVQNLIKISASLDPKTVCASTLSSITAYHMIERAKIKNGVTVLITGSTGGVGSTAIQILKSRNCQIIATTSHKDKIHQLKKLGADKIIATANLVNDVKKVSPDGIDYVIDIMGGQVWSYAIEVLKKNGTMVFCSTTLPEDGRVNIVNAFAKQLNILGSCGGTIQDMKKVIRLLQNNLIKPVIDSIYPLDEIIEALSRLDKQKVFGKILLKVNPTPGVG